MIYLTLEEILGVAAHVIDGEVKSRDVGLLEAAAALLLSICQNRVLIEGNKRLALAATIVMLGVNGWKLTLTNDEAYNLVIAVTSGDLAEVAEVAEQLRDGSTLR